MANEMQQGQSINVAVSDINEAKGKLQQVSSKLEQEISSMQSQWQGQGGSAFQRLHQTWTQKHNEIVKALDQLTQGLENARKVGSQADENVSGSAGSVLSNIDSISARLG